LWSPTHWWCPDANAGQSAYGRFLEQNRKQVTYQQEGLRELTLIVRDGVQRLRAIGVDARHAAAASGACHTLGVVRPAANQL
jgi:hypothetical protein